MNIPNILTCSRLIMTAGMLYVFTDHVILAAVLFVAASVTDFLDGYLARRYNAITAWGKIMDPIADKFLILGAFGLFADLGRISWWVFWVIAVREVGVTLFRFWAMSRGQVLAAEKAGKAKTVTQIAAIGGIFAALMTAAVMGGQGPAEGFVWLWKAGSVLTVLLVWASVILTVISGLSVFWNNRRLWRTARL